MSRTRSSLAFAFVVPVVLAACSSGPPGPPALSIGTPTMAEALYDYTNNASVRVSVMGQSMALAQEGTAELSLRFRPTSSGLGVTLEVQSLDATLSQPMGAPVHVDESHVEGTLQYTLDGTGNATVTGQPTVRLEASRMVSPLSLAHGFFPGLPGRVAMPGDRWVDTISFVGDDTVGRQSETSIFEYTVRGDTVVAGRALLNIGMSGTTQSSADMDVGGMSVHQSSEIEIDGHVLWDYQAGLMYESMKSGSGTGTVSVPIAPGPLPITIETSEHARLRGPGS